MLWEQALEPYISEQITKLHRPKHRQGQVPTQSHPEGGASTT